MGLQFLKSHKFNLYAVEGVVLEQGGHVETHTYGGGSNIGRTIDHIQTEVRDYQNIWLATEDGREVQLSTLNCRIPCRPGHRLTVIGSHLRRGKDNCTIAYYNHNTGDVTHDLEYQKGVAYLSLPLMRRGGTWMALVWLGGVIAYMIATYNIGGFKHVPHVFDVLGLLLAAAVWGAVLLIPAAIITMPQVGGRARQLRKYIEKSLASSDMRAGEVVNVIRPA